MDDTTQHQQLIARVRAGEAGAAGELLGLHLSSLLAYVRLKAGRLVRSKESMSDVVQSVCREVLADLPRFRYQGTAQFRHWLFTHALHKIQNKNRHYRAVRRAAEREVDLEADDRELEQAYATLCTPSRHAVGREDLVAFERAFAALPDEYREAVLLRRVVGMDYPAIAAQLGKSEGAVRNLVYRGIARLAVQSRKTET
ncbi:MAG: sigma-70 family RNA polymerase sigma factor [Planctomycetota bacterium]